MQSCYEKLVDSDLTNGVHLVGIGGVGMTALAEMLLDLNIFVTGSDSHVSKNVERLKGLGIRVYSFHNKEHIGDRLVCRTRAIKDDNEEVIFAKKAVYRSTLLSFLAKGKKQLVVTGSHGKTTTSALLAHCMKESGFDISFAVGGFSPNLGRYGKIGGGEYFVIEGDESDGSHLKTEPYGGVLTSCDIDHLAYWKRGENLLHSYEQFIKKILSPEHFVYNGEDPFLKGKNFSGRTFGMNAGYDYFPQNVSLKYMESSFTIKGREITFPMFGAYNIKNAIAIYALLESLGVSHKEIQKAFISFKGIFRRMEYLGKNIYSDYAHHPEEVKLVLASLEKISDEIKVIFEPHRLSRFQDELEKFCKVFNNVIITDVFEASEGLSIDPMPLIKEFCAATGSSYIPLSKIKEYLQKEKGEFLGIGAGALDGVLRDYVKEGI